MPKSDKRPIVYAVPQYWTGQPDKHCDLCNDPIDGDFVDGRTVFGPWANMCIKCHGSKGLGLGTGKGQHYRKQPDGRWLKIGG